MQGRAGRGSATARFPWSSRDLPQLFLSPKENSGCLKRWDHPHGEGRKKPFSRALPPGNWESDAAGGGRARAARHSRRCQHKPLSSGCQVDFLPAPHTHTCGLLRDTSLYFCNLRCPSSPPGNHRRAVINDTQAGSYTH